MHGNARLTDKQIQEIKDLCAEKKLFHREIADMYGVCRAYVSMLARGEYRTKPSVGAKDRKETK